MRRNAVEPHLFAGGAESVVYGTSRKMIGGVALRREHPIGFTRRGAEKRTPDFKFLPKFRVHRDGPGGHFLFGARLGNHDGGRGDVLPPQIERLVDPGRCEPARRRLGIPV